MSLVTQEDIMSLVNSVLEVNSIQINDFEEDITVLGVSSIAFIQIVVAVEDKYSIEIPDEYLIMINMNTINKMTEVIGQQLAAG